MIDLMELVMEARKDDGGIAVGAARGNRGTDYGANAPTTDNEDQGPQEDPTDATDYSAGAPEPDEGGNPTATGGATGEGGPPAGGITVGGPDEGGAGNDQNDQATDYGAGAPGMDDTGDDPGGGAPTGDDAGGPAADAPAGADAGPAPEQGEGDPGAEGDFGDEAGGDDTSNVDNIDVNKEMGGESDEDELKRKQLSALLLRKSFIRLHAMIGNTISKINEARKNSLLATVTYNQAKENLVNLQNLVFKYITLSFDNSPPDINTYNFNYFMEIFNWNIEMIEKVHKIEEKSAAKKNGNSKSVVK